MTYNFPAPSHDELLVTVEGSIITDNDGNIITEGD